MKISKKYKRILTIPNILSLSRILFFPILLYLSLISKKTIFLILYIIVGATDALDGFFARRFKIESDLGVFFDDIGDYVYYTSSIIFLYIWNPSFLINNLIMVGIIFFYYIFPGILIHVLTKKNYSLHLYSWKIWSVLVYSNIIYYIAFGQSQVPFYILFIYSNIAFAEEMIIILKFKDKLRNNLGSLFLVNRGKKNAR